MRAETREIAVGACALAALVMALAFFQGGRQVLARQSTNEYRVTATFNRVDGLAPGDAVHLGGVRIGKVEAAELDRNFRARLTLLIRGGVQLPEDTSAAVHTDGLFGAKFIVLLPGGEEKMIPPGGVIGFTQESMIVSELLDLIIAEGRAARAKPAEKKVQSAPIPGPPSLKEKP